jgi:hypothetical protein
MTPRKKDPARAGAPHDPLPQVLRRVAELARLYGDHELYCALRQLYLRRLATTLALGISSALNRAETEQLMRLIHSSLTTQRKGDA